jgi:hypothetical protein
MNLLEKVKDLHKQSTTDKSHYYTRSVLEEVIEFLETEKLHRTCFGCLTKNKKVQEAINLLEQV